MTLYVRKSDGMMATALTGPYSYTSLLTAVLTDPVKSGVKCKLSIDERGNLSSPAANTMWSNTCNAQQTAYGLGQSGLDGTQKYSWSGVQIRTILNSFPNDTELNSRWKFSANGTTWLSIRLKLKKGQGY